MQTELTTYIEKTSKDQLALLEQLVLQPSCSSDKTGVDAVGHLIRSALQHCPLQLEIDRQTTAGDNLVFSTAACTTSRPFLLVGHMDTVYTPGSSFNYFRHNGPRVNGPGVIDMKGGLVTAIFVLQALHHIGLLNKIPLRLLCNSDEETGSLCSSKLIHHHARKSRCGLVFECGGLNGELVTGRKGKRGFRMQVFGQAGHAAFTLKNGKASAIVELAHKILALEALNNKEQGRVVNIGTIHGGTAPNVIPDYATAEIDTRFITEEDGAFLTSKITEISESCTIKKTTGTVSIINFRFPMAPSQANKTLYQVFARHASALDLPVQEELRCGVSDANIIAECGTPVLDGLGPIGDLDHSDQEYMITDSLNKRILLSALAIIDLWQNGPFT